MSTAQILPMKQPAKANSEAIFLRFLLIIQTHIATNTGSVLGLDVLSKNPQQYWCAIRWSLLSEDDRLWLVQACQVPVENKVSEEWRLTSDTAKHIIYTKTQGMAKRAKQLLAENKAELEHAVR